MLFDQRVCQTALPIVIQASCLFEESSAFNGQRIWQRCLRPPPPQPQPQAEPTVWFPSLLTLQTRCVVTPLSAVTLAVRCGSKYGPVGGVGYGLKMRDGSSSPEDRAGFRWRIRVSRGQPGGGGEGRLGRRTRNSLSQNDIKNETNMFQLNRVPVLVVAKGIQLVASKAHAHAHIPHIPP